MGMPEPHPWACHSAVSAAGEIPAPGIADQRE
jgi:hypothetical protein